MTDLFHWLLATFVFTPLQAEINEKLGAMQAPRGVIAQVETCFGAARPKLVERANGDWFWGITTVISVGTGMTAPEKVLADEVPACRQAIESIRPLLNS